MQAIGSVAKTAVVGDVLLALNSSLAEAKDKVLQKIFISMDMGTWLGIFST